MRLCVCVNWIKWDEKKKIKFETLYRKTEQKNSSLSHFFTSSSHHHFHWKIRSSLLSINYLHCLMVPIIFVYLNNKDNQYRQQLHVMVSYVKHQQYNCVQKYQSVMIILMLMLPYVVVKPIQILYIVHSFILIVLYINRK